jgi:hypothetical protein
MWYLSARIHHHNSRPQGGVPVKWYLAELEAVAERAPVFNLAAGAEVAAQRVFPARSQRRAQAGVTG